MKSYLSVKQVVERLNGAISVKLYREPATEYLQDFIHRDVKDGGVPLREGQGRGGP
jgi:hypothetical protein